MFQMDSNSGQPFFGVDLLRSRRTAQSGTARPASPSITDLRDGPTTAGVPVATVSETRAAEPSLLERLKLKRPPERVPLSLAAAEEDGAEGPVEEFR